MEEETKRRELLERELKEKDDKIAELDTTIKECNTEKERLKEEMETLKGTVYELQQVSGS